MFPLFYSDATPSKRGPIGDRSRPILNLPGLDFSRYPEIEENGGAELPEFGEMTGLFQMPFPVGMPYMDFLVMDINGIKNARALMPLQNVNEYFYLETLFINWPKGGEDAGPYPEMNPDGTESPMPKIQISSSDPARRVLRNSSSGPEMFTRSIPLNHISGQGVFKSTGGFALRRGFWFSPEDVICFFIEKQHAVDPRWISIGIAGRMVKKSFLQGFINGKG